MKLVLNGRGGKVGRVLAPALEQAGHELRLVESNEDPHGLDQGVVVLGRAREGSRAAAHQNTQVPVG